MTPWCVLVCSWRCQLDDRHSPCKYLNFAEHSYAGQFEFFMQKFCAGSQNLEKLIHLFIFLRKLWQILIFAQQFDPKNISLFYVFFCASCATNSLGHLSLLFMNGSVPALSPPCGGHIMYPLPPHSCARGVCIVPPFPCMAWVPSGVVGGGWWHKQMPCLSATPTFPCTKPRNWMM